MAFLLTQGASTLYKVDISTGTATALTLPTGVTLSTTRKPKFALLNQWVAMVNSPSKNLLIDPEGIVAPLALRPPLHGPSMAAGSGTGLTGAYMFRISFIVKNSDGDLLSESVLSPSSVAVTLANQDASLTDIAISPDAETTGRRVYRTLSGGASTIMFHVFDIDDNTSTSIVNNTADATVTLLPTMANTLVSPPGTLPGIKFKNIVQWKSRFWGIADDPSLLDTIYASSTNKVYTFPDSLVAYPTGQDEKGIIGFGVRRNQLGFLKRSGLWMISSSSGSTGVNLSNVSLQQVAFEKAGCIAEDTIITINDKVYWLGRDGVYEWDDDSVHSITDDLVAPWFRKDGTYFNRSRFENAFARYNEITNSYELHLAATGSSDEDRWISFNLTNRKWFGPHKTALFTPSHAGHLTDADGLPVTLVGATSGVIYTGNSANKRDGAATAIDMDCFGPFHSGGEPDYEHYWGELSMLTKVESAGTLEITPYVGRLGVAAGTAFNHTLTTGRERLQRLGRGALARLRFRKNTVNQSATIYGYEISPYHVVGRR